MADSLTKLAEALSLDRADNTKSVDLVQNLRSDDSVRPGLETLYLILDRGVAAAGDAAGKLGLQSWSDSQIQDLCSLASVITHASRSLSGTSLALGFLSYELVFDSPTVFEFRFFRLVKEVRFGHCF